MENPKCFPAYRETIPALDGWNMAHPMEPKDRKTRSMRKEGATPMREIKMMDRRGPPRMKVRAW